MHVFADDVLLTASVKTTEELIHNANVALQQICHWRMNVKLIFGESKTQVIAFRLSPYI